jgi:D-galactarolactone cycloisomerase
LRMKISRIRAHRFEAALERPIADARNVISRRAVVLVQVELEGGVTGWGEAACFAGAGRLVAEAVAFLGERLVGEDAGLIAGIHDRLFHESQHFGRRGVIVCAISGIDCALWDALGKEVGAPVATLLGRCRDSAAELETSLAAALARSPSGVKIKIGRNGADDDGVRIRQAREVLGPRMDLMVDANSCLDRRSLAAVDEACVAHNVRWIEEPVPFSGMRRLGELRRRTRTPIAGYEIEMTLDGYGEMMAADVVDVVQPDTIWSGGITTCSRIGAVARLNSVELIPHNFGSLMALASNAHLAAHAPTGGWLEVDSNPNPFLWDLDANPAYELARGAIRIPERPGLGVDPDLRRLARYRVS